MSIPPLHLMRLFREEATRPLSVEPEIELSGLRAVPQSTPLGILRCLGSGTRRVASDMEDVRCKLVPHLASSGPSHAGFSMLSRSLFIGMRRITGSIRLAARHELGHGQAPISEFYCLFGIRVVTA